MRELDDWFFGCESEQERRDRETHENLNRMLKSQTEANQAYIRNNEDYDTRQERLAREGRGRIGLLFITVVIILIFIYLFLSNAFVYKGQF